MGFDEAWLDSLDEDELHSTYEWARSSMRRMRDAELWGLAHWYQHLSYETMEALSRLYKAEADPRFDRRQMSFDMAVWSELYK